MPAWESPPLNPKNGWGRRFLTAEYLYFRSSLNFDMLFQSSDFLNDAVRQFSFDLIVLLDFFHWGFFRLLIQLRDIEACSTRTGVSFLSPVSEREAYLYLYTWII